MPVGTRAAVKGVTIDAARRARRRDHPRQHLSPAPAARRRSHRARSAACTRSWGGRGRSSPTPAAIRCSASPTGARSREDGVVFQSHLDGRALPLDAGVGRRHSGAARVRRRDDVRRVSELAGHARRRRGRDGAHAAMGAPRTRRVSRRWPAAASPDVAASDAGPGAVRHRPGRHVQGPARPERRRDRGGRLRGLRHRRAVGRRADRRHVRHRRPHGRRSCPADRAAVPDGRRHARRPRRERRPAASTSSTACCRPGTPGTASSSPARARSPSRTRGTPRTRGRPIRSARVRPAGATPGPICGTCSWPARWRRPPLTRCIICTFTLTPCGRLGRLLSSEPSTSSRERSSRPIPAASPTDRMTDD